MKTHFACTQFKISLFQPLEFTKDDIYINAETIFRSRAGVKISLNVTNASVSEPTFDLYKEIVVNINKMHPFKMSKPS